MSRAWILCCAVLSGASALSAAPPAFEAEVLVQCGAGPLQAAGYSVPAWHDWTGDGLPDLVVGEGGGAWPESHICLFPNTGGPGAPVFASAQWLTAGGLPIVCPGAGCLGAFPRVVDWDGDPARDLLVGLADGRVTLYHNAGAPGAPELEAGVTVMTGPAGGEVPLDVGERATADLADWNADGLPDLVSGGLDGRVHVFLNQGTSAAPDYPARSFAQAGGTDLLVPSGRSSPIFHDFDGDGRPDLLCGNTEGQLLYSANVGAPGAPAFSPWEPVLCGGQPFNLTGTLRTRPTLGDWNADGLPDLLVGYGDGRVHLCLGRLEPVEGLAMRWTGSALQLEWPAGAAADRFRVYRAPGPGGPWDLCGETIEPQWTEPLPAADAAACYRVTRCRTP